MRRFLRRLRRRAPLGYDSATWDMASRYAREAYEGRARDEPHVHLLIDNLTGVLSRHYRGDRELRDAQAAVDGAGREVEAALERQVHVGATRHGSVMADAAPRTGGGVAARAQRSAIGRADRDRKAAERDVREARRRLAQARGVHADAQAALVNRLVDLATAGVVPINTYVAAFNLARQYEGRPAIEVLGDSLVEEVVQVAVRAVNPQAAR